MNELIKFCLVNEISETIYYAFHVLGVVAILLFNLWSGKKRGLTYRQSVITTLLTYALVYVWIYIQYWAESGFQDWGGKNIVRGFVYIPILALPAAKIFKIERKKLWDFLAAGPPIAQGISHIGCIFTGCCSGFENPWGIYNLREGTTLFPVQLFEAATALIIGGILVIWMKKNNFKDTGKLCPAMLIVFGLTRFFWEFFRDNEKIFMGCSVLAFHALFMAIVGIIILCVITIKEKKDKSKPSLSN